MPDYQKRQLAGMVDVGDPGPLPDDLVGLADADLADLDWTYEPLGYHGYGFFPIVDYVPFVITRLQFISALQQDGSYEAVATAVLAKDVDAPVRIYFLETANFDRRDERFVTLADELSVDEEGVIDLFRVGATVAP